MIFGCILDQWSGINSDLIGLLFCFLASTVCHSDFLKTLTACISEHAFGSIVILHNADLLNDLKKLNTTELGEDVAGVTGMPLLYIESANLMKQCVDVCNDDTLAMVKEMAE